MFSKEERSLIAEVEGFAASAVERDEVRAAVHPLSVARAAAVRVEAAAEPAPTILATAATNEKQPKVVDDDARTVVARLQHDLALLRKIGARRAEKARDERDRSVRSSRARSGAARDGRGCSGADEVSAGGSDVFFARGSQRRTPLERRVESAGRSVAARSGARRASPTTSEGSWSRTSSEESCRDERGRLSGEGGHNRSRDRGGGARTAARDDRAHSQTAPQVLQPTAARGCCYEVALYINDVCCGICDCCLPRLTDAGGDAEPKQHAYTTLPRSGGGVRGDFSSYDEDCGYDDYDGSSTEEEGSGGVGRSCTQAPTQAPTISEEEEDAAAAMERGRGGRVFDASGSGRRGAHRERRGRREHRGGTTRASRGTSSEHSAQRSAQRSVQRSARGARSEAPRSARRSRDRVPSRRRGRAHRGAAQLAAVLGTVTVLLVGAASAVLIL
jgi:hypothetical protein